MAAPRHRSRPLHNFTLPELRWDNQRLLRCINLRRPIDSDGIVAVRERLMLDLKAAADRMKLSMSPEKNAGERPWNLRSRRAACKAMVAAAAAAEAERGKFSVELSRAEVEEDYREMAGLRLPRRPKKRPRAVQREIDTLFPGLWLTEITPETYKVDDVAE